MPLLAFHGTADEYLAFDGGYGAKVADLPTPDGTGTLGDTGVGDPDDAPPVIDRLAMWADLNGCDELPVSTAVTADVELLAGCDIGLYIVDGGGHSWPGSEFDRTIADIVGPTTNTIDATELIWTFFRQHPLTA